MPAECRRIADEAYESGTGTSRKEGATVGSHAIALTSNVSPAHRGGDFSKAGAIVQLEIRILHESCGAPPQPPSARCSAEILMRSATALSSVTSTAVRQAPNIREPAINSVTTAT